MKTFAEMWASFWASITGHGAVIDVKERPPMSKPASVGVSDLGPFPAAVIAAAIDAADDYPSYIWPSVTLAQWALESNYGKNMPAGSNNPFGIKAVAGQPSVSAMTTEVLSGKTVKMKQPFRKFADLEAAFSAHNRLLATSKYYAAARLSRYSQDFMNALTGVYATDPYYGDKLMQIAGKYNLYRFDKH